MRKVYQKPHAEMHVAVADVILGSTPLNEDDFFTAVSAEVWL